MPHFKLHLTGLATGGTANSFKTILGLKFANVAGNRARLRKLAIGGAAHAPQDVQVSFRMKRTDNTSDGTSTAVNVNTIGKADPNSAASKIEAIAINYGDEPTTFSTETLGLPPINSRLVYLKEWGPDDAPIWGPNQTLCVLAAPGSAEAVYLDAVAEWEEF